MEEIENCPTPLCSFIASGNATIPWTMSWGKKAYIGGLVSLTLT